MFFPPDEHAGEPRADAGLVIGILQLISHVTLAGGVVAVASRGRGHAYLAAAGVVSLLVSLMYHTCRGGFYCFGFLRDLLRKSDHIAQLHLAGAFVLHLILYDRGRDTGVAARTYLPFVVMLAVLAYPYQTMSTVLVLVYLVAVVAYRLVAPGGLLPPMGRDYDVKWLLAGVALLVVAAASFVYSSGAPHEDTVLDGVFHVLWHFVAGLALMALSRAVVMPPRLDEE